MTPSANDGVAVVIPVLGDTVALGALLGGLRALAPRPVAIVVVDAAASSACRSLCEAAGAVYRTSHPGRGQQLHAGAMEVPGSVLWFLHADATVSRDAVAMIRAAVGGGAIGGHFRFRFTGAPGWRKTFVAALINLRTRFGIPYGDQGLFVTRDAYLAAGGFPDVPLFEEVPLVKALRQAGSFVALDATIGVSPRRYERDGWLRRSLENRLLALAYMAGAPPEVLARRYRTHQNHADAPDCPPERS